MNEEMLVTREHSAAMNASVNGDVLDTQVDDPIIPDAEPIEDPPNIGAENRIRYFRENLYPYPQKMGNREYNAQILPLQIELVKLQNWIRDVGERLIIIFEGRDAAGKGGSIRRFMEHWNPRGARVVALDKPSEVEQGQWYFQRYISHFPTAGEIVLYDRSWYNRAGVERVMGFSSEEEYRLFIQQAPILEKMIADSGINIVKLYFSVSRHEQLRRFQQRANDPLRQWKVSAVDIQSIDKWEEYTEAKEAMFLLTHSDSAPWTIIKSDDKKRARINAMRYVLNTLDYEGKDESVAQVPDPTIVASSLDIYTAGAPRR
ncbi:MAG: polyphosphate kinase 2 [Dehalococcoidia bacterium]|nr:polyphosphate kinase 2 [Dehalococcoidia bacterium]